MTELSIILLVVLTLFLFVLFAYLLIGYSAYHNSLSKKGKAKRKIENNFAKAAKKGDIDVSFWQNEKFETLEIYSDDNLKLSGVYINNKNTRLAIVVHGYGGCHDLMTEYVKLFQSLGCDILAIDLRAHGKSEGNV